MQHILEPRWFLLYVCASEMVFFDKFSGLIAGIMVQEKGMYAYQQYKQLRSGFEGLLF